MSLVTVMVWTVTQSQTFWSVKSSGPYEALLSRWMRCNPVMLFKTLKDDAIKLLHSICQQIWKTQQWLQDWKRSLIPIPKTIALISYVGKVMLKILHGRLQHYVNQEFPDINLGLEKAGARDQIANICWIIEKQGNSRKTSTSVSSTMLSLWLCGS